MAARDAMSALTLMRVLEPQLAETSESISSSACLRTSSPLQCMCDWKAPSPTTEPNELKDAFQATRSLLFPVSSLMLSLRAVPQHQQLASLRPACAPTDLPTN
eukprot:6199683-Pleurochrysis_carterae.AAC.1